ncbi:MAG: hypothetical protein methR_P0556 [Methyloprofundus sp.]|nr:MAG: hypothetical protein methR_P0556 [Methyloprofundus sp.]
MINPPLPAKAQHLINTLITPKNPTTGNNLDLKIGQQISASVLQTSSHSGANKETLQLLINSKQVATVLRNNQPANSPPQPVPLIQKGQVLQLLVVKLLPQPEFKLLQPEQAPTAKNTTNSTTLLVLASPAKPIPVTTQSTLPTKAPQQSLTTLNIATNNTHSKLLSSLTTGQKLSAQVLQSTPKSTHIQLFLPARSTMPPTTQQNNTNTQLPLPTTQPQPNSAATINLKPIVIAFAQPTPTGSTQALQPQQTLLLQVSKSGLQPQFTVLPRPNTEQVISTALRTILPKERASTEVLNQLLRNFPELASNKQVPATLKRLAQEIISNLPSRQQLTNSSSLKNSLNNSGLFLEAKLVQPKQQQNVSINTDFKATLLKLLFSLQHDAPAEQAGQQTNERLLNLLKELQTKSEGTLARLMLNQFKSLPQEDPSKQVWTLELPFLEKKQTTALQIQIEADNPTTKKGETANKTWSASITLTPPNLHTLHCKISFFDNTVHTNFWSQHGKTTQLIQNHLDYLSSRLEEAGLTPGNMNASQQAGTASPITLAIDKKNIFDDNA